MKKKTCILMVLILAFLSVFTFPDFTKENVYAATTFKANTKTVTTYVGAAKTVTINLSKKGTVKVSSSNASIASISTPSKWKSKKVTFKVTGKKAGTTNLTITNSVNKSKLFIKVVVKDVLNKTSLSLKEKGTYTLKTQGVSGKATWSTSNKNIATVSTKGVVKGVKPGTATITAKVGSKKYTCKVTVTCTNHTYTTSVTKAATCTQAGTKTTQCSKCGYVKSTSTIAKLGHKYEAVSETDTTRTYKCSRCKNEKYETITPQAPETPDTPNQPETPETPTNTCSHSVTSVTVVDPTCTAEGYTLKRCMSCGYEKKVDIVPVTIHNWQIKTHVSATCTDNGYIEYQCTKCKGTTRKTEEASGNLHEWEVISNTATCGTAGVKTEKCKICNATQTTNVTAGGEHDWKTDWAPYAMSLAQFCYKASLTYATNLNIDVCKVCGEVNNPVLKKTSMEAAEEMLGYVNELRASVGGIRQLKLDADCVAHATYRASQLSIRYGHYNVNPYYCQYVGENICKGHCSISDDFSAWKHSQGHCANMVNGTFRFFGYGMYVVADPNRTDYLDSFGVQIFTDGKEEE